jgi:hypothetical protein
MLNIHHSILSRIPFVHLAADADRSSAILAGVMLTCTAGVLVIAATDGKLLIEECYELPASEDFNVILSEDGVKRLGQFLKATVSKRSDAECVLSIDTPRAAAVNHPNGTTMILPLCEGTYPAYAGCMSHARNDTAPSRFALSSHYLALLEKAWATKGNSAIVMEWRGRGVICSPLSIRDGAISRRALVMPIPFRTNPALSAGTSADTIRLHHHHLSQADKRKLAMTRKEYQRRAHQLEACRRLGLSEAEAETLRRASMTLSRWGEMECNHDVQRDEATNKVTIRYCRNDGNMSKPQRIADRETPAIKRCEAIAKARGLVFYHQGDPRGAQVYIGKPEALDGKPIDQVYSRLTCVY